VWPGVWPCVCVSVCDLVCVSVCDPVCDPVCVSQCVTLCVCLSVWPGVCLSVCLSVWPGVCVSVWPCVWPCVCVSVCDPVCVSLCSRWGGPELLQSLGGPVRLSLVLLARVLLPGLRGPAPLPLDPRRPSGLGAVLPPCGQTQEHTCAEARQGGPDDRHVSLSRCEKISPRINIYFTCDFVCILFYFNVLYYLELESEIQV